VLDGGHNPAGLARVGHELRRLIGDERLVVVFGAMSDKDLDGMLAALRGLKPHEVVFTAVETGRATPAQELARRWGGGIQQAAPAAALERARALAGPEGTVLACGSLYLVGELRALAHA
jgi:dihydrofolate synthase/folylpolyglutamate synthase